MAGRATLTTVESTVTTAVPRKQAMRTSRLRWLVIEERIAVLAALQRELGYGDHPVVVVRLDLVELVLDALGGPFAEGLGDVELLAGNLDVVLLEMRGDARQDGDLGVDVRHRVCQPLLVELPLDDALAMLPEQPLGDAPELLDLVGERFGQPRDGVVGHGDLVRHDPSLDPP